MGQQPSNPHLPTVFNSEKSKGLGTPHNRTSAKRRPVGVTFTPLQTLPSVPCTQVHGRPSPSTRPISHQPPHPMSSLQDDRLSEAQKSPAPSILAHVDRLIGRFLTRPGQLSIPEIPVLHTQRKAIPISSDPLRPQYQPSTLHQNFELPAHPIEKPSHHYLSLSGRLDSVGKNSTTVPGTHATSHTDLVDARLSNKPRKVADTTYTTTHLPRSGLERQTRHPHSVTQELSKHPRDSRPSKQNHHLAPHLPKTDRAPKLLMPSHTRPYLPRHSDLQPGPSLSEKESVTQTQDLPLLPPDPVQNKPPAVPAFSHSSETSSHLPTHLDRCLNRRMGSSHRSPYVSNKVETHTEASPHYGERNPSGTPSPQDPKAFSADLCARLHRLISNSVLHQENGIETVSLPHDPGIPALCLDNQTPSPPHSVPCARPQEHLGRQPVESNSPRERMDSDENILPNLNPDARATTSGPFRSSGQHSPPSLCGSPQLPSSSSHGRSHHQLEPVEENIPISTSIASPRSPAETNLLPRTRHNHNTHRAKPPVVAKPRQPSGPRKRRPSTLSGHTKRAHTSIMRNLSTLPRLEFLTRILTHKLPKPLAEKLARPHRPSTINQYQSAWVTFQSWVKKNNISWITTTTFLAFLDYLFSHLKLAPQTVMTYRNALALPLHFAFNISTKDQEFNLLARSQFITRPPIKPAPPQWSLIKVLDMLASDQYCSRPPPQLIFEKALFLTALATANRASELASLHHPSTVFSTHTSKVTLLVKPGFIFKNQRPNRAPPNITMRSLFTKEQKHHKLCPVANLKAWLTIRPHSDSDKVFVDPKSKKALNSARVSLALCRIIKKADPSAIPKGHDLRKVSTSLAWARGLAVQDIVQSAFWSKPNVFIEHYLHPPAPEVVKQATCVALSTTH